MSNNTEYIFKQDFWGNWKLIPSKPNSGLGTFILLIVVVLILMIVVITSPFWLSILGFAMNVSKRYYAAIFSILGGIYFLIDLYNNWLTGVLFLGYNSATGEFHEGMFNANYINYVYAINIVGILIGFYFIYQSFSKTKQISNL